jgi:single-stranded-DNA-specific exonuclease
MTAMSEHMGRNGRSEPPPPPKEARVCRWSVIPSPEGAASLEGAMRGLGLHPVAAKVLVARGWTAGGDLERFISPLLKNALDPFALKDMDRACDRLARAVAEREPVLVYGDYDVDGGTATAVLVNLFRFLNVPVRYYIPNRLTEGYGLKIEALQRLAKRFRLIVTVDTGTTCLEEADYARRHGIDLVITDHHRPSHKLPEAVALVNPNRADCSYPDKCLAGVGVAFKLAHGLLKRLDYDSREAVNFLRGAAGPGGHRHDLRHGAAHGREPRLRSPWAQGHCQAGASGSAGAEAG